MTLAMEHNGDMYSCDHFVSPEHFLGNIADTPMIEMVASPKQQKFGQDKLDLLPRYCRECQVRFACHGGCPKDRFIKTPKGEVRTELSVQRIQGLLQAYRSAPCAS